MATRTYQITDTTVYVFNQEEAVKISQAGGDYRPFDDNGGETDGPSYLIEVEDWPLDLPVEDILSLSHPTVAYKLEGYTADMEPVFKSVLFGNKWMGHQSGGFALFKATDKQLAALETALAEIEE